MKAKLCVTANSNLHKHSLHGSLSLLCARGKGDIQGCEEDVQFLQRLTSVLNFTASNSQDLGSG